MNRILVVSICVCLAGTVLRPTLAPEALGAETAAPGGLRGSPQGVGLVKVEVGNLRSAPSTQAAVVGKLMKGELVTITAEKGEWYRVTVSDDRVGWAHRMLLLKTGTDTGPAVTVSEGPVAPNAIVRVPIGRVRGDPSLDSPIRFRLKKGDAVAIVGGQGEWHRILLGDGRSGWAHRSLLEAVPPTPAPLKAASTAPGVGTAILSVPIGRVRAMPGVDAEIVFRLKRGARVSVIETRADWYRIILRDGRSGWAHRSLLTPEVSIPPAVAPGTREIRSVYAQVVSNEEEKVVFELNGLFEPKLFVVTGKRPKVVCDFFDVSLDQGIGPVVPFDGKLVERISIEPDEKVQSYVRVILSLVPENNYHVQPRFQPSGNLYALVVTLK